MTSLSTEVIRSRLASNNLNDRLVISPLLDADDQVKPGQASVDIRLGFEFGLVVASLFGAVDELVVDQDSAPSRSFSSLYRKEYVPFGDSIVIHPHQLVLATSLEYIRLPPDLMAYVVGRSTWGRMGLIVATAVGVHPNYAGALTLELRNLGETPLRLYPGQSIGQLFFHTVQAGDATDADPLRFGQYGSGSVDIVPKRISSERTQKKLYALVKNFRAIR